MEIVPGITDFSCSVLDLLTHSVVFHLVVLVCILRIYCRMTVGMCNCDQDMTGKTVLITGATSGIGKATAFDLARRNARVLLASRNLEKAAEVAKEIVSSTGKRQVEIKRLELCSFDSVRECAKDVMRTEKELHVLINNAGMEDSDVHITQDGCERVMQSNHLGHFLLTLLLLDLLKKSAPSRIINVSSLLYVVGDLNLEDMNETKRNFWNDICCNLYSRSKLASILFTRELASRLSGTGVTVNAAHPGVVATDLFRDKLDLFKFIGHLLNRIVGKTPLEGAQTSIYLAVHPEVEKTSGKFFYDCRERMLLGKARDMKMARRLFEVSQEIVGTTYPSASES